VKDYKALYAAAGGFFACTANAVRVELMPVRAAEMDGNSNELQSIKWAVLTLYFFLVKFVDVMDKDLTLSASEFIKKHTKRKKTISV
jgi:hypothetical protein